MRYRIVLTPGDLYVIAFVVTAIALLVLLTTGPSDACIEGTANPAN